MEPIEDPNLKAIITALENPKFKWRTVEGIAKEIDRSPDNTIADLKSLVDAGAVIRSTIPSVNGEELYSTPKHYKSFANPIERLGAACRNRRS